MALTLEDLGIAYRKAKVDLFYSSHASLFDIASYENKLFENLTRLYVWIVGPDESWVSSTQFLGDWMLVPKKVTLPEGWNDRKDRFVNASSAEEWEEICERVDSAAISARPEAEFRVMSACSIDFHVLSALWILKVGSRYDAELGTCAFGNRVRRGSGGEINPLAHGSFMPYMKPFRDWRNGGIESMHNALDADKKVVALTADVAGFYHELNPGFMLKDDFNNLFQTVELNESDEKLHRLFIKALQAWAQLTPLKKGLPVGLPASAIVANVALIELDRMIEANVVPLYYARYVDDIMLVIENKAEFKSPLKLWEWIFARSNGLLGWSGNEVGSSVQFRPNYLMDSAIRFENDKNKVFLLQGDAGRALVASISYQIKSRASEWRALPNLPINPEHIATDLLAATQTNGEEADNLRKADALTMRRAGFAMKLRDFEAYERDLAPEAWKEHRHAFLDAFILHVMVLPQFFELSVYLPRVIRLATACEDFGHLGKIIEAAYGIHQSVGNYCKPRIKSFQGEVTNDEALRRWFSRLVVELFESVMAAFPPRLSREGKLAWQKKMKNHWAGLHPGLAFGTPFGSTSLSFWSSDIKDIQNGQAWLFSFDLAHVPFRLKALPKEMVPQRGIPTKKATVRNADGLAGWLPATVTQGIETLGKWIGLRQPIACGLLFATRPFNLPELFILRRSILESSQKSEFDSVVLAVRGFLLNEKTPAMDSKGILRIPDGEEDLARIVAVSSWKTDYDSWIASVVQMDDPDLGRYARLTSLVNGVISQRTRPDYFIMPELSIPAHWFIRISRKLQSRKISLIAGVEYLHAKRDKVRNQVWAALSHDGLGFPSTMIYRQDKQRPALHEEQEIKKLANLELAPDVPWKAALPPIIQHGEFRFSMLICSELTNIRYRSYLRGQVDAVFVPEWNQDTDSFNSLVESAALDVHAFIIQCNDRQFGDSRIRAPNKDSWKRDVLRVKGGVDDYCVTGKIDVLALRSFQSSHRSPNQPFKPVPDGFVIAKERIVLPTTKPSSD